jgi:glycosyltransferase involved in cell wall biosynthesis
MKILLSAYACRPNAGTEPGYGWNWATHLAARDMDVHVLTAGRYQAQIESALRARPVPNLKFSYVHVPRTLSRVSEGVHYCIWQLSALSAANRLVRDGPFDLVHHVTYGSVHVPSQLWRLNLPVIFGPVGGGQTAPASMLQYFGSDKRKEQVRTAFTRALRVSCFHRHSLRKMSFILAANLDTLKLVQRMGCQHTALMCDAGLPESFFAAGPRKFQPLDNTLKLLWVGRMLPRKALLLALDAVAQVRHPVTLTIVGDGLDPSFVWRMIADRKLQNKVSWQERRLTWSEVRASYLEHDVMLFTSLRDSFGSQQLEAMALGLPLINLDLHGAHDFIPPGAGLKVLVGSPNETIENLATAIERYAVLPVQRKNEMSQVAWNCAQHFKWTARAELMEETYKGVLTNALDFDGGVTPGCAVATAPLPIERNGTS